MTTLKVLYYFLIAASFVVLLVNRKHLDRRLHLFMPLLLLALFTDGARDVLGEGDRLYDFLFSIYTPAEYTLISVIIASFLNKPSRKKIIYYSIPFFIVIAIVVQMWLKQKGFLYSYLDILIEAPLLCVWTLLYFFQLAADKKELDIKSNPMFWISIGNLLFFSASTFSYGFGGYLEQTGATDITKRFVFGIGRIFNLVLYIFYIIAFLCRKQTPNKMKY